jgi:hypothetical protein
MIEVRRPGNVNEYVVPFRLGNDTLRFSVAKAPGGFDVTVRQTRQRYMSSIRMMLIQARLQRWLFGMTSVERIRPKGLTLSASWPMLTRDRKRKRNRKGN